MSLSPTTHVWIACRTIIEEHATVFLSRWEKAAETFEEEDIHDFRVSSRRLREALALFAPSLAPRKRKRLVKRVKGVTSMLGDLRNADEAFAFFSTLAPEESKGSQEEVEALLAGLRQEREQAHIQLREELGALDPDTIRDEFRSLQDHLNFFAQGAAESLMDVASFWAGAVLERERPIADLLPQARQEGDGPAQHRLRIAVKKLRYRLEIMESLMGSEFEELHATLKEYQDALGKLHDLDVFAAMVGERVRNGSAKRDLLRAIAGRRKATFATFLGLLQKSPVDQIGEKARAALLQA